MPAEEEAWWAGRGAASSTIHKQKKTGVRWGPETTDSVPPPLSAPAQGFLGKHPGHHLNHALVQLHQTMRNSKLREVKGFA